MSHTYRNFNYAKQKLNIIWWNKLKTKFIRKEPLFCETCGIQIKRGKFCSKYCSEFETLE